NFSIGSRPDVFLKGIISISDESKATRIFSVKNQSNKKELSECSDLQHNLCLVDENNFNNTEKGCCCSPSSSSKARMANDSTNAFASSERHSSVGSPLKGKQPTDLGDTNYLTPSKSESEPKPNSKLSAMDATPPIDFSTLTASDFGITPESFTKQNKGLSKSVLNKFRRRSTIGIRGSPENNSLIRYIARRRQARNQDALVQASPFKHQNTLLREKIAAFQSSFKPLDETEERQIHVADTSKEINSKPHEQSELDQVSPSERERIVFEENATQKSVSGGKSSPDIQGSFNVSPSLKPDIEKDVPSLLASSTTSGCMILETTSSKGISRTSCAMLFSHCNENLSQNATSQQSCKKVRFAKKLSLEIFDETKPPVTPVQRGHLSSSSIHSVLKKTPTRVGTGHKKVGIEHHFVKGSTKPVEEIMVKNEDIGSEVHDTLLSMDIPLHKKREILLNSPHSRGSSPNMTPVKQPFSQPDFDQDDDQESSKYDNKAKEADFILTSKMQIKNSKQKPSGIQKAKPATKSYQKKKPAARRKVFGKKRRRKKEEKALYGRREAVSKIPLLSPIPEVIEDISLMSSYQNTSESQTSIFDYSISSVLHGESVNGTDEASSVLKKEDGGCLHPNLDLLKSLDSTFSQLEGDATNVLNNILPLDSPIKNSPEKLTTIFHENEQVLKNDCTSGKSEIQEELELLHLHGAGKNIKTEGVVHFSIESAAQLISESDSVNFKRFPRRSRRLAFYLPNNSETPGNISSIPEDNMEEPLPASDDFELLNSLQCCIDTSFNNTSKRVRRSMRRHKDAENEGLVWIQIPANNVKSQDSLDSSCNIHSGMSSIGPQESELLHEKKLNSIQLPFIMSEDQENVHFPTGLPKLKKRKSTGVLSAKENDRVVLHAQRNRRASLGYKSDHCFQKCSEMRQFLKNQPMI
ncbi:hypothetical protein JD844_031172, partial [Phrynosoma platyrhinos]